MERELGKPEAAGQRPLASASTGELVGQLLEQTRALAQKELALARAEVREDLKREQRTAEGLGVAGVCALCTLNLMLVAVAFALAEHLPGWASALIVAAVVLAVGTVAGLWGWSQRVKAPLEKTQKTAKENLQWAKERLA